MIIDKRIVDAQMLTKGLACYEQVLELYRMRMNLIGHNEIIGEHILDCLAPLSYILDVIQNIHADNSSVGPTVCIDLGTGAGFPGIPLLLACVSAEMPVHWYLIEKSNKKSHFLRVVLDTIATTLHIPLPVSVINSALETWKCPTVHSCVVTARAFRPLNEQYLAIMKQSIPSGIFLLYKGKRHVIETEIISACHTILVENIVALHHFTDKERNLVHMRWK